MMRGKEPPGTAQRVSSLEPPPGEVPDALDAPASGDAPPFWRATMQVVVGGALVFAAGILIGSA